MKARTILLSVVLILIIPGISEAQIGNVLKNKVGRAVNAGVKVLNKETDKKIDSLATKEAQEAYDNAEREKAEREAAEAAARVEATDEAAETDAVEERNSDRPSGGFNIGGIMGGGKVSSEYSESYSFNNRIYMEMEMYDNKEVTKMNYFIYFNDDNMDAGFESKMTGSSDEGEEVEMTSSFIFDGNNKSFLMMTDMGGMRIGVISEVPEDENTDNDADKVNATFTKTGKTREIAGYLCDEYLYTDNDTKEHGLMWATKELRLKADKRTFAKTGLSGYYGSSELDNSVVLAMEQYDKKDKLEMKSEAKEVNLGYKHTILTTGYSFRQVNYDQAGGK